MITIISSQRYTDNAIVAQKLTERDFVVSLSPKFIVDGHEYAVVLDGHHSLVAARVAGEAVEYVEATATDHDAVGLIEAGKIDEFLIVTHMGDDYYDVATGLNVW